MRVNDGKVWMEAEGKSECERDRLWVGGEGKVVRGG